MELLAIILLVILGCRFPGLLIDTMNCPADAADYREKRYSLGACFGAILLLLVLILN